MSTSDPQWEHCSVDTFRFSFRTQTRLAANNICTVHDLTQWSAERLLALSGFGQGCLAEVEQTLASVGLSLAETVICWNDSGELLLQDNQGEVIAHSTLDLTAQKEAQRQAAQQLRAIHYRPPNQSKLETATMQKWKAREPIIHAAIAAGKNLPEIAALLSVSSYSLKGHADKRGWNIPTARQQQDALHQAQIVHLSAQGRSVEQTAEALNLSVKYIQQLLHGAGMELPETERQQHDEHRKQYVAAELVGGARVADIAASLAVSKTRLYQLMDKWGLEKPRLLARICSQCGKEFLPHWHRQQKCRDCPYIPRLPAGERGKKHRANWERPEYREKMLARMHSPEYRAHMSERAKARWNNPEFRERVKDKLWSDERRQQQAQMQRDNWQDPAYRQKQHNAHAKRRKSPIHRERMLALWQDPSFRAKMCKAQTARWVNPTLRARQTSAMARGKARKARNSLPPFMAPHEGKEYAAHSQGILPLQVVAVQGTLDL